MEGKTEHNERATGVRDAGVREAGIRDTREKAGRAKDTETQESAEISVRGIPDLGDINGGVAMGFVMLCFCFWANAMGFCDSAGFTVAIGVVMIGFFVFYLVGGLHFLKEGKTVVGSIYVVFSASFGLFGGVVFLAATVCEFIGIPCDTTIVYISFVISGTFLFFMLPCFRYAPKVDFLVFLFAGIGVTVNGLGGLGFFPEMAAVIGNWSLLFAGILCYYSAVSGLLKTAGISLPSGAPFFKEQA